MASTDIQGKINHLVQCVQSNPKEVAEATLETASGRTVKITAEATWASRLPNFIIKLFNLQTATFTLETSFPKTELTNRDTSLSASAAVNNTLESATVAASTPENKKFMLNSPEEVKTLFPFLNAGIEMTDMQFNSYVKADQHLHAANKKTDLSSKQKCIERYFEEYDKTGLLPMSGHIRMIIGNSEKKQQAYNVRRLIDICKSKQGSFTLKTADVFMKAIENTSARSNPRLLGLLGESIGLERPVFRITTGTMSSKSDGATDPKTTEKPKLLKPSRNSHKCFKEILQLPSWEEKKRLFDTYCQLCSHLSSPISPGDLQQLVLQHSTAEDLGGIIDIISQTNQMSSDVAEPLLVRISEVSLPRETETALKEKIQSAKETSDKVTAAAIDKKFAPPKQQKERRKK